MKSVRFDFDNADALCNIPCHTGKDSAVKSKFGWEYQKQIAGSGGCPEDGAYTLYKKKQLGERGFNALMLRAHQPARVDESLVKIQIESVIANLKRDILGAR